MEKAFCVATPGGLVTCACKLTNGAMDTVALAPCNVANNGSVTLFVGLLLSTVATLVSDGRMGVALAPKPMVASNKAVAHVRNLVMGRTPTPQTQCKHSV